MRLRSGWREDVEIPVEEQGVMLKLAGDLSRLPIRLSYRLVSNLSSPQVLSGLRLRFDWRKARESRCL